MTSHDPRTVLLDRVVEYLLVGGHADSSLRTIAAEVGSSHRMLLYHFHSHEGLLAAVVDAVEARQRSVLSSIAAEAGGDLETVSRRFWCACASPELAPLVQLFFGLYVRLLERGDVERASSMVTSWLDPVVDVLRAHGVPLERAQVLARLGMAVTRGLLLDLAATGDRHGVDAAMEGYLEAVLDPTSIRG